MGTSIFLAENSTTNVQITQLQFGFVQRQRDQQEQGSIATPTAPTCPMLVITYTNRVFYETALGFYEAIRDVGIHSVEIWGDMSQAFHDKYTQRSSVDSCPLPLQIAIAPHEDTILLPRYVVLHMEQTWSLFSTKDMRYKQVVENAISVWLMSWNGMQSFFGLAINPSRIFVVPLYTRFDYALKTRDRLAAGDTVDDEKDRVAMLGSHSDRREAIISELQPLAQYLYGAIANPSALYFSRERDRKLLRYTKVHNIYVYIFLIYSIHTVVALSSHIVYSLSLYVKVILNIHSNDDSSLEVHRINTLLAHGCCIISERGSDPALTDKVSQLVV